MPRKKSSSASAARLLESDVPPILEINYKDPLFAAALHPTRPIFATGTATGYVHCFQYDLENLEESQLIERNKLNEIQKNAFKKGESSAANTSVSQLKKWWPVVEDYDQIPENSFLTCSWKTKRHKGSCRALLFDPLENSAGEHIYSVGTDHALKKANTETGKIVSKVNASSHLGNNDSFTKLAHSTTHPFLLAGTDNGEILVFDSTKLSSELKFKVENVHDDAVNHILPMPAVSAYHYLTLGSTTLSHIDIRKGVLSVSDDQEDELLSMCYPNEFINDNKNDTVLVSHGEGIVTIWKNSKNNYADQLSRIKINKHASIDVIVPTMNQENEDLAASVWCGDSDGFLYRLNYKKGRVVETRVHSSSKGNKGVADEVGILDIDYEYRLLSAGMDTLKLWSNRDYENSGDSSDCSSDSEDTDDSDSDPPIDLNLLQHSVSHSSSSASEEDDSLVSDDDEYNESDISTMQNDTLEDKASLPTSLVRKKRTLPSKRSFSEEDSDVVDEEPQQEQAAQGKIKKKKQEKKLTAKQLKNMQRHEHGIRKFEGL